jgi:G3E family GTPase
VLTDNGTSIPAIIIGGYLGAGKTSLVNHLLRNAMGLRIAVLVNDFGDLVIDEDLIEGQHGDVMSLSGGCVCCSFGADLVGSLQQVLAGTPPPEFVLIETSGVGLPAAVARSARLAFGLSVEAIVVVADAQAIREQAANTYLHDTVLQQLREADLLLLNKVDLVESDTLQQAQAWLATVAPVPRVVMCSRGQVPSEVVLGPQWPSAHQGGFMGLGANRPAQEHFCSVSFDGLPAQDVALLASQLAALGPGVLRAKGILTDHSGNAMRLQLAGGRVEVTPHPHSATNQLVLIGLRHLVSESDLARLLPSIAS